MPSSLTTSSVSHPVAGKAAAGSSRRRLYIAFASVTAAVALAAAAWGVTASRNAAQKLASVDIHTVSPRSFTVALQEKGELKAAKSTEIACQVEGRSTIITLIPEGTSVVKGDLLVELASDQIDDRIRQEELREANAITAYEASVTELDIQRDKNASDIRKAKLKIELASLELEKYRKGDWVQRSKDAEIEILRAQTKLRLATESYEASKQLRERNFITQTQFDDEEFEYQKAQWDLEKAKQAKLVLEKYTHIAELRQKESDLEEAVKEAERVKKNAQAEELKKLRASEGKEKELALLQDQLAKLRRQMFNCRITAPTKGTVVYYAGGGGRHFMSNDSQIREGATVHERQVMMTLPDTSKMLVIVRVHEAKTDKLRLGQSAIVRIEGIPDKRFIGRVTKIAAVADSSNRWLNPDLKEYETEITLEPTDEPLKPGVTAHAEILVETVGNQLAVPVQAVYTKRGHRFIFASLRKGPEPREVQLGAIGTEWAEITSGLAAGDKILLAFGDEHKRMIPDLPPPASDGGDHRRATMQGSSMDHNAGDRRGRKPSGANRGSSSQDYTRRGGGAGSLASFDKDGDGKIQKSELPEPMQAMFDRLDSNGDGALDKDEVASLIRRSKGRSSTSTTLGASRTSSGD